MAATEIIKISPALQRFLDEGQDDDIQEEQNIPASLELGQLDFTTTETSLKGGITIQTFCQDQGIVI